VTLTATSVADASKSASATITILEGVTKMTFGDTSGEGRQIFLAEGPRN
jgi:hypothetical protein